MIQTKLFSDLYLIKFVDISAKELRSFCVSLKKMELTDFRKLRWSKIIVI